MLDHWTIFGIGAISIRTYTIVFRLPIRCMRIQIQPEIFVRIQMHVLVELWYQRTVFRIIRTRMDPHSICLLDLIRTRHADRVPRSLIFM